MEKTFDKYRKFLNEGLAGLFYEFNLHESAEEKSYDCYIELKNRKKLIDCLGGYGVFSLGHCNQRIINAVKKQMEKYPIQTQILLSERKAELAEKLVQIAPEGLEKVIFAQTGAGAIGLALKIAILYKNEKNDGRGKILSTHGAFHGKELGALSVTGNPSYREPFEDYLLPVDFIPYGDATALKETASWSQHFAFIVEPIQGEGGIKIPPQGYLQECREICNKHDILFIVDEIQTGLGRTGKMFAVEHENVSPDIMTIGKALGGGIIPISAVITRKEIFSPLEKNPLIQTSTFEGTPLGFAAGCETLSILLENDMQIIHEAEKKGDYLKKGLQDIVASSQFIKEVRGKGLFIGVEYKEGNLLGMHLSKEDAAALHALSVIKQGVLTAFGLNNKNTIRYEPPLIINYSQLDNILKKVEAAHKLDKLIVEGIFAKIRQHIGMHRGSGLGKFLYELTT